MQPYLLAAGLLTFLVAAIHSVLGEFLIFRRMRTGGLVPTHGAPVLRERHVRILWANWHLVTAFGAALGALLVWMGWHPLPDQVQGVLTGAIIAAMLVGSMLVLVATKGRHPGWIGLLGVAWLTWMN